MSDVVIYSDFSLLTDGHAGTALDPYSAVDLVTYIDYNLSNEGITVFVRGFVDLLNSPLVAWYNWVGARHISNFELLPWDAANYGPLVFWDSPDSDYAWHNWMQIEADGSAAPGSMVIDRVCGQFDYMWLGNETGFSSTIGPQIIKGCYFAINEKAPTFRSEFSGIVKVLGCTFSATRVIENGSYDPIADDYAYFYIETSSGIGPRPSQYLFYDCVFNISNIYTDVAPAHPVTVEFHNCYFNKSQLDVMQNLVADPNVTLVVGSDCVFSYDYGSYYLPTTDKITVLTKSDLAFGTFNIPTETDPTILQRWVDNDYNTGLFGEPRLGVGAFYFMAPVNFSGTPVSGLKPLTVQFTDLSPTAVSWYWDFGDGTNDDTQNPEHIYTAAGFYTVSLTIDTGTELLTETKTDYIKVGDIYTVTVPGAVTVVAPTVKRSSSLSCIGWVRNPQLNNTGTMVLMAVTGPDNVVLGSEKALRFEIVQEGNDWQMQCSNAISYPINQTVAVALDDDAWHFLAWVCDDVGNMSFYVDARQVPSLTTIGPGGIPRSVAWSYEARRGGGDVWCPYLYAVGQAVRLYNWRMSAGLQLSATWIKELLDIDKPKLRLA